MMGGKYPDERPRNYELPKIVDAPFDSLSPRFVAN
jgi:hypothetical protein